MADYLLLMHSDADGPTEGWDAYLAKLKALGCFQGGSQVGGGRSFRKDGEPVPMTYSLGGFIRVTADDLAGARKLLDGNPVYEAGGTVEIRELLRTD
jgi:hypothetical protein